MAKHNGGMQVEGGYYWNPRKLEVEVVPSEGGRLKGAADSKYVKVPFPALFVIVPLLGALFIPVFGASRDAALLACAILGSTSLLVLAVGMLAVVALRRRASEPSAEKPLACAESPLS